MRTVSGLSRLVAGGLFLLCITAPAVAQEEKPIDPDRLESDSHPRLPLQISGFAVGNYDYRFSNDENSFGASALAVSFFRVLSDRVSFFGQLATHRRHEESFAPALGSARLRPLSAAEPGGRDFKTEIDNLQVAWAAAPQRGLQIIFGKFDSPLAIERDDAPLNLQATPSFVFQFTRPVKFTGIMAKEAFSPRFEGFAILANGWDVSHDNNRAKTAALYGVWSPWVIAHFGLGVIHGAEQDGRVGDPRTTGVATILVQQTDAWLWGEEIVYGREPHAAGGGRTADWFGDMFFTHHRLGKHWALTLRTDYLDDIGGSRTGRRQVLRSFTLSPQYLVGAGFFGLYRSLDRTSLRIPELTVRLDLRIDRSSERVFPARDGAGRRDSASAAFQLVYVF